MDCLDDRFHKQEIGYFSWDIVKNLVFMDGICASIFEFNVDAGAAGVPIEAFLAKIHMPARERVAKAIHDCLLYANNYHEEYTIGLENGTSRWVKVDGRLVLEDGVPVLGIGTMMDTTVERLLGMGLTRQ